MKKGFFLGNILLIFAVVAGDLCYMAFGGLWLKTLTSAGFFLLGLVNLVFGLCSGGAGKRFPILMVLGLALSLAGDVVINLNFIPGALLFGVGHVFYAGAYCALESVRLRDGLMAGVVFVLSAMIILLYPAFDFGGSLMLWVCLGYALVISCMVGKALSNLLRRGNTVNLILAIGSVLFYFSDLMLVLCYFADGGQLADNLCLISYYPAQCLLAHSIFHNVQKERQP